MSILGKGLDLSWKVLDVQEDLLKTFKGYDLSSPVFLVFNYKRVHVCLCTCMYVSMLDKDVHKRKE